MMINKIQKKEAILLTNDNNQKQMQQKNIVSSYTQVFTKLEITL